MNDIMQPPNQCSRVNLSELKAQLFKRLGPERSVQYFDCLNRLLSLRLSKFEFDNLCMKLLGKENLALHNQLIRGVLQNACSAKIPPHMRVHSKGPCISAANGPLHLRKNLTTFLGLNGEGNLVSLSRNPVNKISNGVLENGSLKSCESQKPLQHHQELRGGTFVSGYKRVKSQALVVEEENNVHKFNRSQLQVPVRNLFHPVTVRNRNQCSVLYDSDSLLGTKSLREQMQHIAADQGLEGVTLDCAKLLNLGLNSYLKTLIASCIQLARTRSTSKLKNLQGDELQWKLGSGISLQEERSRSLITLLEMKAAIELRSQVGEDWPLLVEKISVPLMK